MNEIEKLISACRTILGARRRGVVVTIVRTVGSTYRRAGARVVISETGEAWGAISGGCIERDLAERIRPWLSEMTRRIVTYDSTRDDDLVFGMGLGCRGVLDLLIEPFDAAHPPSLIDFRWNGREPVEWTTTLPDGGVLVEIIRPPRALVIFGAGHDVPPLVDVASQLGWQADVITTREAVDLAGYDAAVVMTHNFERDAEIVARAFQSSIPYIGLLGPRSRGDELLAAAGLTRDSRFHSPIGLDLGAETPEEIALSIVAEIQAVLSRRSGAPLRSLDRPIHDLRALSFDACAARRES